MRPIITSVKTAGAVFLPVREQIIADVAAGMPVNMLFWQVNVLTVRAKKSILTTSPGQGFISTL
ncbi:MAG: hypothetical protein ACYSUX_11590 [Planctomycetota bacterium]